MFKTIASLLVTLVLALMVTTPVSAREGVVQMESRDGDGGKCFVVSMLFADGEYRMLVNCRGLKYPISENLFQYVLWAQVGDDDYERLGTLGIGKREFGVEEQFDRLVVTKEAGSEPRNPSDSIYMIGGVSPIAYLSDTSSGVEVAEPTPTPVAAIDQQTENGESQIVDEEAPARNIGVGTAIRFLGIVVLVVVVLVVVIAFISASRRRPVDV